MERTLFEAISKNTAEGSASIQKIKFEADFYLSIFNL